MKNEKHIPSIREVFIEAETSTKKKVRKVFVTRSGKQVAEDIKNAPKVRQLCGGLLYEGEQTILFAKTGKGKTILATQMAFAVARGESLNLDGGVVLRNEVGKMNTLFFDLELSDSQKGKRLGEEPMPEGIFFAHVNRGEILDGTPEEIFDLVKAEAEGVDAKFIIIDNVSRVSGDIEKAENAKKLMDQLFKLCRHDGYTILVIAHPKKIDEKLPLDIDSVSGSSKFTALSDAVIGINSVNDGEDNKFYIKQMKTRNGEKEYSSGNVICTEIKTTSTGFVNHFCYEEMTEGEALNATNKSYKDQLEASKAYEAEGSYRKAAEKIGVSKSTLKRRVDKHKDNSLDLFVEVGEDDDVPF